ncbi:ATP-binding protein [Sphingomonas montana]|uniref:ATP-binding protein n=1 Tax=Sphingomonas montana TaxID=1843236 RepID=UPI00096D866B|nr:ATP-binding protein [Sphingomonas montana]
MSAGDVRERPRRGLPIFWQTLLLVLASLMVAQAVSVGLFLSLRPPRPDYNRLSDVADALAGVRDTGHRDRGLRAGRSRVPPMPGAAMVEDAALTRRLAERLSVPVARVRFYYEPDQRSGSPVFPRGAQQSVPLRRGEPIFFNTVVAGVETARGWRVVETPPRPLIGAWQKRSALWFGLSAVLLLPFVWFFARRLTRPIRRFADAADRMGADPHAPRIAQEGPAELRIAAQAINHMQDRMGRHLAERTAMIGAIAHDLRTPLARVAFRIEGAPDAVRDKVQADIDQMRAMISATIGFVRDGTGREDRHPVALDTLLSALVAGEREVGRAVTLSAMVPVTVAADALSIQRLVQNLVDNAVRHAGAADVAVMRDGGDAVVTVSDRGPGLPDDMLERVFEPFGRGDPSRNAQTGGTGLGLTIARSIATRHGGRLTLDNRPGGGLTARFVMPAL